MNIITAPEIEMLIVFSEGKFLEFKKKRIKPSEFCKDIGYKNVKSPEFINNYFEDVNKLIKAINEYKRVSNIKKGEYTLADLLK